MKRFSILCILFVTLTWSIPSHAQFFKKLKKVVNNTVNEMASETDPLSSNGNATGGIYTVNETHADLSAYHPADIYTLQPGEKFDFTESCLAIHAGISSEQVVIIKNGKRYLIGKNGVRSPVTNKNLTGCPAVNQSGEGNIIDFEQYANNAPNVDEDASLNFEERYIHSSNGVSGNLQMKNTLTKQQEEQMEQLADKMKKEEDTGSINMTDVMKAAQFGKGMHAQGDMHYNQDSAGTFILFNHKKYGPYAAVLSMLINKKHNKFVAIVLPGNPDMPNVPVSSGSLLITSEGLKQKIAFSTADFLPYGDFNHYRLLITDGNGKEFLYDPATRRRVPIPADADNLKIDKPTGAIIQINKNKIFIDGKLMKTLPEKVHSLAQNIYVSKDHSRCAVWTMDGLFLPDGKMIDGVVSCTRQVQNGKPMVSWIVLGQDNKTLYLCHAML